MGSKKKQNLTDDELLDQYIQENAQCFLTTCSKSIKLIRLKCHLCSKDFCTSHILPEIHGCGGAARKASAEPPKKSLNPEKAAQLESKMNKKLQQMKNDRKRKGK